MISQDIVLGRWVNNRFCNSSSLLSLIGLYLGHMHMPVPNTGLLSNYK